MQLIINGQTIEPEVLEQEFNQIKASYEGVSQFSCCCDRDPEFRGYAKQNVISRVLLTQEALNRTEPIDGERLDQAVEELKTQHGGPQQFYAKFNIGPEQEPFVRRDVEINLRVQHLLEDALGPDPEPTEQELHDYYQEHLDRYMTPERVRVSHILKAPPKAEDREPAYELLRKVRDQALDGADFTELAREHSDKAHEWQNEAAPQANPEARDGIDLGFFGRGEMMEEFERPAFSMRIGEISPVFTSMFGLHLIQLTGRQASAPRPFESVRQEVRTQLMDERRQQNIRHYIQQLESRASIEMVGEEEEPE